MRISDWSSDVCSSDLGGYGTLYGTTQAVPGREFSALVKVEGASQPHRVLVQVPDAFDTARRCVVVAPASGSRGVYGAISIAGAWGLPKGCAVAYTDKGAGTDYFDLDAQGAARADGTFGTLEARDELAFAPDAPVAASEIGRAEEHTSEPQALMRIS